MRRPDCIAMISSVAWDYLRIAPQQTARHLKAHLPILYVDRQTSVAGLAIEPAKTARVLGRWARGVEEALRGRTAADLGDACSGAADGTNPPSDLNGDADYRRHLAAVVAARAVADAKEGN